MEKNYDKRVVTRVEILARHYFAHWDNLGEAFVVERIPIRRKRESNGWWITPPKKLTYRVSKFYFESIKK